MGGMKNTGVFTASNGVEVQVHDTRLGQRLSARDNDPAQIPGYSKPTYIETYFDPRQADALREFFQAERDKELGRWRWPDNPDYVVYKDGTSRRVIRESTGAVMQVSLHDRKVMTTWLDSFVGAAKAYDEAHPERKPWEDAKHGEVWAITVDGETHAAYVDRESTPSPRFITPDDDLGYGPNAGITDARRIWPES